MMRSMFFPQRTRLLLWLLLLLAIFFYLWRPPAVHAATVAAADQPCPLTLELVAAPYAIVDHNQAGVQGPQVVTLGVRITNSGNSTLDELTIAIGDGSTAGAFAAVNGQQLRLLANERATKTLSDMAAGATQTLYWMLAYPLTTDANYPYRIWATIPDGCTQKVESSVTPQATVSAAANKLAPSGSSLLVSPSKATPGSTVSVRATGFTLGSIGKGSANRYDAWLQPVGNLDYDPACLELIRTEVRLYSIHNNPLIDQLYLTGLNEYAKNSKDYVEYTFLVRRECTTKLQLYQQAASGSQAKYNSDYRANTLTIVGENKRAVVIALQSDKVQAHAGERVTLKGAVATTKSQIGHPQCGAPLVIVAEVPAQTTFVPDSATIDVDAKLQYSVDGGKHWQNRLPANGRVTHLRWRLRQALDTSGATVGYIATLTDPLTTAPISFRTSAGLLNAAPMAEATLTINGAQPTPTPTPPPTATPDPGVGSGGDGGLESGPLPVTPSAFLGSIGAQADEVHAAQAGAAWHKARLLRQMSFHLDDLMPTSGPAGTTPKPAVPVDVLAVTTAPDAKAVDFVDSQGKVEAVVLGILSVGAPYAHDYGVCNRFKGYTLQHVRPHEVALPSGGSGWFWQTSADQGAARHEETLLFHLFIDETNRQFHIDSRWTGDSYPTPLPFTFDYVMNMQVWSKDLATSTALLTAILARVQQMQAEQWQVIYHNQTAPTAPALFVQQAANETNGVALSLVNNATAELPVRIYGSWRSHLERQSLAPVDYTLTLPPGQSDVRVNLPDLLDATLFVESNGFTDKIYSGGGLWFAVNPQAGPATALTMGDCRASDEVDLSDLLLAGCVDVTHAGLPQVDSIGVGRTLNPNGLPTDVSPYGALRFWAKGNGTPVRVLLESAAISDGDYYQTVFTPQSEWRQYIIPLREFAQRGFGSAQPFTGTDLKAVLWLNADTSGRPFTLQIDQVSFTNSGLLQATTLAQSSAETGARPVQFTAPSGANVSELLLYYSVDDGRTYQSTVIGLARTEGEQQIYQGQLPGQPLGSEVRYYGEAHHHNGYISHLPLDAPQSFYRYRVDDRVVLLIDDFGGERLHNRLGAPSGIFNAGAVGGQLIAYAGEQQLVLDFNVAAAGQFAGYYTELTKLDSTAYTTLDLLVRGETGGEQLLVGLRDGSDFEPRLSVGDFLPGGVTTAWRWVQIPLHAFGPQLDRAVLTSLSLTFDHAYAPASGRLYVRELRLTALPVATMIDTFDDQQLQLNSQGLGYWTSAPNGELVATPVAGDAQQADGAALRLDYTVGNGSYAIWHSDLRPLAAAIDPTNSYLTLWVKGATQPTPVNLYLTDGTVRAHVPLADYVTISDQWQLVQVALNHFTGQGLTLAALTGFEVVFELGSGSGQLWIDNISLGAASAPQVDRRVIQLQNSDQEIVALHTAAGLPWQITSDAPWLSAAGTGAGAATLVIKSEPAGLPVGAYTGHLTITSGTAPAEALTVHLTVTQPSPASHRLFLPVVTR